MSTTTMLDNLVINYLTQEQYEDAKTDGVIDENQLYFTPDNKTYLTTDMYPYFASMQSSSIKVGWEVRYHYNRWVEAWYHGTVTFSTASVSYQGWYRSVQDINLPTDPILIPAWSDDTTVIVTGSYNGHVLTSGGFVKNNGTQLELQLLGGAALAANISVSNCNIYLAGYKRS